MKGVEGIADRRVLDDGLPDGRRPENQNPCDPFEAVPGFG
jgi:hypothetical protein